MAVYWTNLRGPQGDSVVSDSKFPERWAEETHVAWKVPLPGRGWSQPVVANGRIFVTTAVSDGEEKPRRGERGIVPEAVDYSNDLSYRWKLLSVSWRRHRRHSLGSGRLTKANRNFASTAAIRSLPKLPPPMANW